MSQTDDHSGNRRDFLYYATAGAGVVATGAAVWPLVNQMNPAADVRALASIMVDVSGVEVGTQLTVKWRGKPVWIINRTKEMLDSMAKIGEQLADPKSDKNMQPEYAKNETRSIKPEILVAVGICTHLGCSPTEKFKTGAESGIDPNWPGGFICPCHGSTFDLAGRVYKSKPAPDNLEIPPHMYLGDAKLIIGEDKKA